MGTSALRRRRDQALGSGAELFYDNPLEIVRGEGAYLFDSDGRRYVDMYNNVPVVGHANQAVVDAYLGSHHDATQVRGGLRVRRATRGQRRCGASSWHGGWV